MLAAPRKRAALSGTVRTRIVVMANIIGMDLEQPVGGKATTTNGIMPMMNI